MLYLRAYLLKQGSSSKLVIPTISNWKIDTDQFQEIIQRGQL
jgi:hypothetical protein